MRLSARMSVVNMVNLIHKAGYCDKKRRGLKVLFSFFMFTYNFLYAGVVKFHKSKQRISLWIRLASFVFVDCLNASKHQVILDLLYSVVMCLSKALKVLANYYHVVFWSNNRKISKCHDELLLYSIS